MAKVFKDMIEDKIEEEITSDSIIMQWLVRWVAMLYSRYKVGPDGKTAYERQKGRKCKMEVVPFGEKIWYTELNKSGDKKMALEEAWHESVWLGHARSSNEILVG